MTLPHRCAEEPSAASAEATAASNGVDDTPLVGGAAPTVVVEEVAPRLIRSRRKRWLELNPSYYTSASADVELSDPLSYDRLIRQHQTPAEREAEGKQKGWAKTLETSLLRGEAKIASLKSNDTADDPIDNQGSRQSTDWRIGAATATTHRIEENDETEDDAAAVAKAEGADRWRGLIAERFIKGDDEDFDYRAIDENGELDADVGLAGTWLEREEEELWFEDEDSQSSKSPAQLEGETGIQDF